MAENKNSLLLKVALVSSVIVALVYGLVLLFIPQLIVKLSATVPIDSGVYRWQGGILTALGIGTLMVLRNPKNQGIFVTTIALAMLLAGLAMLYSLLTFKYELYEGSNVWVDALPTILLLLISALLWWGRQKAKDILKSDQK